MKYKTTYFKVELNSEIYLSRNEYRHRFDKDFFESNESRRIELEKKYKNPGKQQYYGQPEKNELIKLNEYQEKENAQRFTSEHQKELDNHLKNISEDGWKLHSMQPVTKGCYDYGNLGDGGYGFGFNVLEGFVLLWERE